MSRNILYDVNCARQVAFKFMFYKGTMSLIRTERECVCTQKNDKKLNLLHCAK